MKPFLALNEIHWSFLPSFRCTRELKNESNIYYNKLFIILFLFAGIINLIFISNDLWQDELYTLQHFILVPLNQTLLDYHSTNNHIVFNFLANIYLKLIQVEKLDYLLANPIIIRLLPYSFTLLSLIALYNGAKNNFGIFFAIVVLTIYISSIQIYTFGLQVRGYSLSLLLIIILLNQIFSFLRKPQKIKLVFISAAGFLSLVNLPSTLYLFLSFILLFFLYFLNQRYKNKVANSINIFYVFMAFMISLISAGIFFWFKKHQLEENTLIGNSGNDIFKLIKQPFSVYYRFLDLRLFLLLSLIFIKKNVFKKVYISVLFLGLLIFPFLFYMLHNPVIILRIWVILLPVFCYFLGFILLAFFSKRILAKSIILLLFLLILSLLILKFQMQNYFTQNKAPLDLKYQYHLFQFEPFNKSLKAKQAHENFGAKILLHDSYLSGIKYYLPNAYLTNNKELISQAEDIFFISDNSNELDSILKFNYHVTDSGKNNQFYKWYFLKKTYD